jgi:hypothetical protein
VTLNDWPEYLTAAALEAYGITLEDLRRLCPGAVEYGPASAPYWHRDDLAPLLGTIERGDQT